MNVFELRCTSCLAPLDPSRGPVQRCIYCGTTLMLGADASVSAEQPGGPLRLEQCGPNKIQVIKVIRDHTGLGLKEAKDLAESAPCVLAEWLEPARIASFRAALEDVGARASGGPPRAMGSAQVTSTGSARVLLAECGPNKIAVIKVIREYTGLGLKEAKDLAESAPCVLAEGLDPARASRFSNDLVTAGARVR